MLTLELVIVRIILCTYIVLLNFYFLTAVPKLDTSQSFWIVNQIHCQVNRTNPLPKFTWQHQIGPCLNVNPECKADNNQWRDITSSANFVISPRVDMATAKSTLTIPKGAQSAFFKCIARNARGSDANEMRFFASGRCNVQRILTCVD